ncbi:MAG: flagellar basal body L-ring protein FlgH [Bdellovibrionales bacterium]|nr:flagellar basal body L-ring protein FlgH [Bdellovibrionales bacterium]
MKKLSNLLILLISLAMLNGCASFGKSMKEFLGGNTKRKSRKMSSKKTYGQIKKKKYKRTDHKSIQEQSALDAGSGSLWIERGQGAYLFTQNTNRLIGDLVNVEIDGHPKKQIETKVQVIQNIIDRIKAQKLKRKLASQPAPKLGPDGKPVAAPAAAPPAAEEKQAKFEVKIVPSRITEIMKDGSYLLKGEQPFMIGKREYKHMVKGIVRQEDFDDQGISAETLLDPKFDIVTSKRKGKIL